MISQNQTSFCPLSGLLHLPSDILAKFSSVQEIFRYPMLSNRVDFDATPTLGFAAELSMMELITAGQFSQISTLTTSQTPPPPLPPIPPTTTPKASITPKNLMHPSKNPLKGLLQTHNTPLPTTYPTYPNPPQDFTQQILSDLHSQGFSLNAHKKEIIIAMLQ
jgi:hypothetical protein